MVLSGYTFGVWEGFVVSYGASLIGAVLVFVVSRTLLRDVITKWLVGCYLYPANLMFPRLRTRFTWPSGNHNPILAAAYADIATVSTDHQPRSHCYKSFPRTLTCCSSSVSPRTLTTSSMSFSPLPPPSHSRPTRHVPPYPSSSWSSTRGSEPAYTTSPHLTITLTTRAYPDHP
jgi:hypothetical protein